MKFDITNEKTSSHFGRCYFSKKEINTDLDFICQLSLKDINNNLLGTNGYLYIFYDLDNHTNYDLDNKKRCLIYFEKNILRRRFNVNENEFLYLKETNNKNSLIEILPDINNLEHKESIELLSRRYDLTKGIKIPNYLKEDIKLKALAWILLIKINSSNILKIGDNGSLNYYINKKDLEKKNFQNIYCIKETY